MSSLPRMQACALALFLVVLLGVDEVRAASSSIPNAPMCPRGTAPEPKRTEEVLRRLRSLPEGNRLAAKLGRHFIVCYGQVSEGSLQAGPVPILVLERQQSIDANAARLGHLLHHLVHGLPFDDGSVRTSALGCDEVAKHADVAERAAHAIENDLRRGFQLPALAFEDHSDDYRQRCESLRKEQSNRPAM